MITCADHAKATALDAQTTPPAQSAKRGTTTKTAPAWTASIAVFLATTLRAATNAAFPPSTIRQLTNALSVSTVAIYATTPHPALNVIPIIIFSIMAAKDATTTALPASLSSDAPSVPWGIIWRDKIARFVTKAAWTVQARTSALPAKSTTISRRESASAAFRIALDAKQI